VTLGLSRAKASSSDATDEFLTATEIGKNGDSPIENIGIETRPDDCGAVDSEICARKAIPFVFRLVNPEQGYFQDTSTILLSQSRFLLIPSYYALTQVDNVKKDALLTFSLVDASFLTFLTKATVPNLQVSIPSSQQSSLEASFLMVRVFLKSCSENKH
jgi:hypothetical protein